MVGQLCSLATSCSQLQSWKHSLNHVTLCILSDLHQVFVVIWKLNTTQGQPPIQRCETLSFAPKKRQKSQSGPEGSALIYCLNLGTELWPRTYLGGLMWRMKSSGNAEWILSIRCNTWWLWRSALQWLIAWQVLFEMCHIPALLKKYFLWHFNAWEPCLCFIGNEWVHTEH